MAHTQMVLVLLKSTAVAVLSRDPDHVASHAERVAAENLMDATVVAAKEQAGQLGLTPCAWAMLAQAIVQASSGGRSRASWVAVASALLPLVAADERRIQREVAS